jgi:sortase B
MAAAPAAAAPESPAFTLTTKEVPDILPEYKILYSTNKKLIGWLKIADSNIDYPVMQTGDNEYYLDHNMNQEYDKNGSIFMDTACDVIKPSTNLIVYGHNMKSGQMFGNLDQYSSEKYYRKHPTISFDTIYEKGTYEIMYVFRSHIYSEEEITFKYYQFIDALSEQEFDSNMTAMAAMSLYDTGVTARFGDRLLTLSTCDYKEDDGRFVVVAKKI